MKRGCLIAGDGAPRFVGDPVDVTTGEVRDVATDFRLFGQRGVAWRRCYLGRASRAGDGLGAGHRHGFDWRLRRDVDGLRVDTPLDPLHFRALAEVGSSHVSAGWTLSLLEPGLFQLTRPGEPLREFSCPATNRNAAWLRRVVHPQGGETVFEYRSDLLAAVIDSEGWRLTLTWKGGLLRAVGATGAFGSFTPIEYTYDEARRLLLGGRDAYGHEFAWAYDDRGRVVRKTDRRGYCTVYQYDHSGRCTRLAGDNDLDAIALQYRSTRETTVEHEANRATWCYRMDGAGRLLEIEGPYGCRRAFQYRGDGMVAREFDPTGRLWVYARAPDGGDARIDPLGYARSVGDADRDPLAADVAADALALEHGSGAAALGFDVPNAAAMQLLLPADVAAALIPVEYSGVVRPVLDVQGRVTQDSRTFPASTFVQARTYAYDGNANPIAVTDLEGAQWTRAYAGRDQCVRMRDPLGAEVALRWGLRDRVERVTDPGGCATEYAWDLCDRLCEVRRHGRLRERYAYDGAGALLAKEGPDGKVLVEYRRGPVATLLSRTTWDGVREAFERDGRGRIVRATSSDTLTPRIELRRSYDGDGRLTREAGPGARLEHVYDGTARTHTSVVDDGGARYVIEYRADGTIVDPTGREHVVERLGAGIFRRTFANGTWEVTQYDGAGRCLAKVSQGGSGGWRRRFPRTPEGRLDYREDDRRGRTSYSYDAAGRLAEVRHEHGRVEQYEHDAAGNVLHKPGLREFAAVLEGPPDLRDARRLAMATGNRIQRANGDRIHYDERDQTCARVGDWGELVYVHDALGRLKKVFYKSGKTGAIKLRWEADYDALGRRTGKRRFRKGGREERWEFCWDGDRLAAETLPSGEFRVYVYASPHALVPMLAVQWASRGAPAASGAVFVLASDHRGAVERVESDSGEVVWDAAVHPYGEIELAQESSFYQPFRLAGQYADDGLNVCYARYRYWSPELGRFLECDPRGLGGGLNVYAWPGCPVNTTAALGLGVPSPDAARVREGEVDAELPFRVD